MGAGDGEEMIQARFLEGQVVAGVHAGAFAEDEGFENGPFGRDPARAAGRGEGRFDPAEAGPPESGNPPERRKASGRSRSVRREEGFSPRPGRGDSAFSDKSGRMAPRNSGIPREGRSGPKDGGDRRRRWPGRFAPSSEWFTETRSRPRHRPAPASDDDGFDPEIKIVVIQAGSRGAEGRSGEIEIFARREGRAGRFFRTLARRPRNSPAPRPAAAARRQDERGLRFFAPEREPGRGQKGDGPAAAEPRTEEEGERGGGDSGDQGDRQERGPERPSARYLMISAESASRLCWSRQSRMTWLRILMPIAMLRSSGLKYGLYRGARRKAGSSSLREEKRTTGSFARRRRNRRPSSAGPRRWTGRSPKALVEDREHARRRAPDDWRRPGWIA